MARAGNFGRAGRLLSGLETLAMYLLYFAVGFCVWQERRNLKMWLLFLVATAGVLALGLVVVNAGALYRMRYVFWMMLIVIGRRRNSSFHSLAHQRDKILNVIFRRIERRHQSHFRDLFIPNVEEIFLLKCRYVLRRHDCEDAV